MTGSADQSAKLWDCETGTAISTYDTQSSVRACGFCAYGNLMMFSTEDRKDVGCEIFLYDVRAAEPTTRFLVDGPKVTAGLWGPLDEYLITGHEDGSVCHYDYKVSKHACRDLFSSLVLKSCEWLLQMFMNRERGFPYWMVLCIFRVKNVGGIICC